MRLAYVALKIRNKVRGPVIEKGSLSACAGASVGRASHPTPDQRPRRTARLEAITTLVVLFPPVLYLRL